MPIQAPYFYFYIKYKKGGHEMIMSDKNSNGPQFSKLTVLLCLSVSILGMIGVIICAIIFSADSTMVAAGIATFGCLGVTAEVWYLKKSQAENTIKIYLSAYEEIIKMKKEYGENPTEFIGTVENDILDKVDATLDIAMDDAASPIEKQDIM